MNKYTKSNVLEKFEVAMNLLENPSADAKNLGAIYATLSISLQSRIAEIKRGRTRTEGAKKELEQLETVANCFQSKINTATKESMGHELIQAYRLFIDVH